MSLIFFINLKKLIMDYQKTKDDDLRAKIILIFVNLDFDVNEVFLLNYNLINDIDVFLLYVDFLAFHSNVDFKRLKYITNNELDIIDAMCYEEKLTLPYDPWLKFEIYNKIRNKTF